MTDSKTPSGDGSPGPAQGAPGNGSSAESDDSKRVADLLTHLDELTDPGGYGNLVREYNDAAGKMWGEEALWKRDPNGAFSASFQHLAEAYLRHLDIRVPGGETQQIRWWFDHLKHDVLWENGLGPHNEDEMKDPNDVADNAMRRGYGVTLLYLFGEAYRAHATAAKRDALLDGLRLESPPIFAGLGTALNATHFFEPEIFLELLLP